MCHFMCGSGEMEEMVRMRNKLVFRLDILEEYIYYQTLVWSCYIGAKAHTHARACTHACMHTRTHTYTHIHTHRERERVREKEKACFTKKLTSLELDICQYT